MHRSSIAIVALLLSILACVRSQPEYVVITATPPPGVENQQSPTDEPAFVPPATIQPDTITGPLIEPTADPTRSGTADSGGRREYVVQPGDTLSGIASAQGISVAALLEVNTLENPNVISVGQVIRLPDPPSELSSDFKIIPDSRLVRGPGSSTFDVAAFISQQPGYIRIATDRIGTDIFTATEIVQRVSLEYSVDARLLLALLELKGNWLTQPDLSDDARVYPLGAQASPLGFDRNGLYRQLTWAADQLNRGYYGWKYRGLTTIEFEDGERLAIAPGLNGGTVGVQHMLSLYNTYSAWQRQIAQDGLYRIYVNYFGDPFAGAIDPLVPPGLEQPALTLPFPSGETWFYTGGPHGGWGSGSAWAAVDFAPPDDLTGVSSSCYLSSHWTTAVAPGIIARTDEGTVVLDLHGDGDESTGWTILYLHIAEQDRIATGTQVQVGDRIGRPSCEGGFSTGTHMHIARRYNGEWLPADPPDGIQPPFVMSGWRVSGIVGQEYQGYLVKDGERRVAEQGRLSPENHIVW